VPASSEAGFLSAMLNGVVGLISEPIRCRVGRMSPPRQSVERELQVIEDDDIGLELTL